MGRLTNFLAEFRAFPTPSTLFKNRRFWLWMVIFLTDFLILVVGLGGWWVINQALVSDPYAPQSQIMVPFTTKLNGKNELELLQSSQVTVRAEPWIKWWAFVRSGARIAWYSLNSLEEPLTGTESEIIAALHEERFNPQKPYVITGGHFSDLYVRNLGIFYNALLDPRLPSSKLDWQHRQQVALQTVAYDLAFLAQHPEPVTTLAPLGGSAMTGVNIYAYPSDSLFGILYTLRALQDDDFIATTFPSSSSSGVMVSTPSAELQTTTTTAKLLNQHRSTLTASLNHYLATVLDPDTGLVKKEVTLASARDGVKRQSSFYDNVIAWGTVKLADELAIPHSPTLDHETWKNRILTQFWQADPGIFTDQLSDDTPTFSADTLIVTSTGFLDLNSATEAAYLRQTLEYIQAQALDQPFPLKYSRSDNTTFQPIVGLFAPRYMTSGIWSHWGMEYIKALALLDYHHPNPEFQRQACQHLRSYKNNIEKYGGYPELYNEDGTLFSSTVVKSVLHSGWIVNYEQAKVMTMPYCASD